MRFERFLTQADAATLSRLAERLLRVRDVKFNAAERLIELIATSILLPEHAIRSDCVSLLSTVTYRMVGTDAHRTVHIACPLDASDALAHVSILTPLAIALVGRPVGSIVEVALPFSRIQYVEIVDVQRDVFPQSATGASTDRIGGYRGTHS
jgi:regulator of nucleoside diphosphate kinase